jgi:hypothetical protein
LKDYENIAINDTVYENVENLINTNSNIKTDNNIIINIINGGSGFGSQLTIFMQILHYLKEVNPNIICLPHFSINISGFKYHENGYNNSFFLYYKRKIDVTNLENYKIYFANASVLNTPFFEAGIPPMKYESNNKYITHFNNEYELIKPASLIKTINELKKPLIGLHLRSMAQKHAHDPEYLSVPYSDRLPSIKKKLDSEYGQYSVFVMTETNDNINLAKSIFGNDIFYLDNILRIDGNEDIIPNLSIETSGYKLGVDILNECLAMSLCDKIFVTKSNIPIIISTINPNIEMEEF